MLWSGLVSRVGASHRDNLIAPFPLGQKCPRKITMNYELWTKSAILPQLTYCHIVWNFCRSSDNRKLERIQERALRAIYNRKSGTYDELLKLAKLLTLKKAGDYKTLLFLCKVKNERFPSYIKEIFQNNNIDRYSFRISDFVIPRFNTVTCGKRSLRYLGPFLWSKLDKKVRSSEFLNTFKPKIRKWDLVGTMEDNCKNCTLCSSQISISKGGNYGI